MNREEKIKRLDDMINMCNGFLHSVAFGFGVLLVVVVLVLLFTWVLKI